MNTKRRNLEEKIYRIVVGPNKDLLFDACKYAYSKTSDIGVEFHVGNESVSDWTDGYGLIPVTDFRITNIEHEDGSGHSFNLRGYCRADLASHRDGNESRVYKTYEFKAYYNTQTRKGQITLLD